MELNPGSINWFHVNWSEDPWLAKPQFLGEKLKPVFC